MRSILCVFALFIVIAGCVPTPRATDQEIERHRYRHNAPASLTLITIKNARTHKGGHSALVVNGSHRVLFDPAGTFFHRQIAERNDVIYGLTPQLLDMYINFHSRVTYYTVTQTVQVSPQVAERVLNAVISNGTVPSGLCNLSISRILSDEPSLSGFRTSLFPNTTEEDFGRLANVSRQTFYDDDPDDNSNVIQNIDLTPLPKEE